MYCMQCIFFSLPVHGRTRRRPLVEECLFFAMLLSPHVDCGNKQCVTGRMVYGAVDIGYFKVQTLRVYRSNASRYYTLMAMYLLFFVAGMEHSPSGRVSQLKMIRSFFDITSSSELFVAVFPFRVTIYLLCSFSHRVTRDVGILEFLTSHPPPRVCGRHHLEDRVVGGCKIWGPSTMLRCLFIFSSQAGSRQTMYIDRYSSSLFAVPDCEARSAT